MKSTNNVIRHSKTVSDCRVVSSDELKNHSITVQFTATVQSNNLSTLNSISKRQIAIHKLISFMKNEKGMSWRRISSWLNRSGIKTHRGNTWTETGSSVHSVIKRMNQREERIKNIRHQQFQTKISDFKIKYKGEIYE